ncbi:MULTISPECIES: ATP-binding protein [unclassified Streptomyces]|uniref:ATP-binding protein n=1 Tax=unclassified Streptomyces TaxID=2593676 RepID=UPI003868100F|nr:ATP-binding protein [Streptomyces sp. NBC_00827]
MAAIPSLDRGHRGRHPAAAAAPEHTWPQSGQPGDLAWCTLPAEESAVPRARAFTDTHLAAWRIDGETSDATRLTVSEFVTNSVCHSGSADVTLRLIRCSSRVRVEVIDGGVWREPDPCGPGDDIAEGGRGLALVGALAQRFGVRRTSFGTCAWALLR